MEGKLYFIALALLLFAVGCTAVNTQETVWNEEELAAAMMQPYPDGEVDHTIMKGPFIEGGEEITFEFHDMSLEEVGELMPMGLNDVTAPNGIFRAYDACEGIEKCRPRFFVENMQTGQTWEITFSTQMSHRSLSGLEWLDEQTLAFSQWSNPHYGFRFAIDVVKQEHLLTLITADQCFIANDC